MKDQKKSNFDKEICETVKKLRKDHHLTMSEFGEILGVSASFISNLENPNNHGKVNLRHIQRIAFHFKISPQDLLPEKPIH